MDVQQLSICIDIAEFATQIVGKSGILLGVDYGTRKCGVAISTDTLSSSFPLLACETKQIVEILQKTMRQYKVKGLVIGLPVNMNGTHGEQAEIVVQFAKRIQKNIQLPIYLQDERLTSRMSDNMMKQFGFDRKTRNQSDDAFSASLILESTLSVLQKM